MNELYKRNVSQFLVLPLGWSLFLFIVVGGMIVLGWTTFEEAFKDGLVNAAAVLILNALLVAGAFSLLYWHIAVSVEKGRGFSGMIVYIVTMSVLIVLLCVVLLFLTNTFVLVVGSEYGFAKLADLFVFVIIPNFVGFLAGIFFGIKLFYQIRRSMTDAASQIS